VTDLIRPEDATSREPDGPFGSSDLPMTDLLAPATPDAPAVGDDLPAEPSAGSPSRPWLGLAGLVGVFVALGVLAGPTMVIVIFAIIFSIFLHEGGHYLAAKRSGMKVTEFFIGFGPRIWSFHRGETEYGIKAIWAGAYVKILGMNNLEEVEAADEARTYRRQSYPRRVVTAFAGPAMNLILAFVILVALASLVGLGQPTAWPAVDPAPGSAAAAAGLRSGDELVLFDGAEVPDFQDFRASLASRAGDEVEVVVERDGEQITVPVRLGMRVAGISATAWPVVGDVAPDSAAALASIARDDVIVEIAGEPVPESFDEAADLLVDGAGAPVPVMIERDGGRYTTELTVPFGATREGLLGVAQFQPEPEAAGFIEGVPMAADRFVELAGASVYGMYRFFSPSGLTGFADDIVSTPPIESAPPQGIPAEVQTERSELPQLPPPPVSSLAEDDRVHSIVGIVVLGSQLDLLNVVFLMAVLNVFLAMFNLIPLLPFDGGHMAVATYERIREMLARRRIVSAPLQAGRYLADFTKLIPVTYAVVVLVVAVGMGALWLDAIDPPSIPN
jgi:RIP metalloprotease RseP